MKHKLSKNQLRKILKEALEHFKTDRIPLEKLEKYLTEKYGFTKEEAEDFWFKAFKLGIAKIGIDVTDDYKPYNVITLKNEEDYEIIG